MPLWLWWVIIVAGILVVTALAVVAVALTDDEDEYEAWLAASNKIEEAKKAGPGKVVFMTDHELKALRRGH